MIEAQHLLTLFTLDLILSVGVQRNKKIVAWSSTETEYRSVASTTAELNWVQNLLWEVHFSFTTPPVIYCNNISATYLCANPIFHSRMKHIAINFHIVKYQVAKKELRVVHVHTSYQLVDFLTKPLTRTSFTSHHSKLGVLDGTPILRGHEMKEKNPSN